MNNLGRLLNLPVEIKKWKQESKLPYYLRDKYVFDEVSIYDIDSIFITPRDNTFSLLAIAKDIHEVEKISGKNVVFQSDKMSSYQRQKFIENHIPFVVQDAQIFLPFLGIVLQAAGNKSADSRERFTASTQSLFLYLLINGQQANTLTSLAEKLKVSKMTVSRGVRELESQQFVETTRDGVRTNVRLMGNPETGWKRAKRFLINPVHSVWYMEANKIKEAGGYFISGLSALGDISALSKPELNSYAVYKKNAPRESLMDDVSSEKGKARIELWRYDPKPLSQGSRVDVFSLYLSLREDFDARTTMALDEAIQNWFLEHK